MPRPTLAASAARDTVTHTSIWPSCSASSRCLTRADVEVTGVTTTRGRSAPATCTPPCPGATRTARRSSREAAELVRWPSSPTGRCRTSAAGLPVLVVADPRAQLGRIAACVYGEPARDLLMLGITGHQRQDDDGVPDRVRAARRRARHRSDRHGGDPGRATNESPVCGPRRRRPSSTRCSPSCASAG